MTLSYEQVEEKNKKHVDNQPTTELDFLILKSWHDSRSGVETTFLANMALYLGKTCTF